MSCSGFRHINSSSKENAEWTLIKQERRVNPNWIIHARKLTATNFFEYKIEANVKGSSVDCLKYFKQEIANLAKGTNSKKYPIYEIVQSTDNSFLTYVVHNEPFPFKDTEMSVRYTYFNDEKGVVGVKWHEAWEENPVIESKKLSRVDSFRGSWTFYPLSQNSTKAVNTVQFDPQKMPRWLVEPMVIKFLKGGIKDLSKD